MAVTRAKCPKPGYLRTTVGAEQRNKFVLIKWVGERMPPMARARMLEHEAQVKKIIKVTVASGHVDLGERYFGHGKPPPPCFAVPPTTDVPTPRSNPKNAPYTRFTTSRSRRARWTSWSSPRSRPASPRPVAQTTTRTRTLLAPRTTARSSTATRARYALYRALFSCAAARERGPT